MKLLSSYSVASPALLSLCAAASFPRSGNAPIETIDQYPFVTAIENIAIRANNNALITMVTPPELHLLAQRPNSTISNITFTDYLLYEFPTQAVLGITEYGTDVFAVVAGNLQVFPKFQPAPGTYSIWRVDLRKYKLGNPGSLEVKKLAAIPPAQYPNGMTTLPTVPPTLLISDSMAGEILRFDPENGKYETFFKHPTMAPAPDAPGPIGINGLRYFKNDLYYVNSFARAVYKLPLPKLVNGISFPWPLPNNTAPQLVVQDEKFIIPDDFAVTDNNGLVEMYVAGLNTVVKVQETHKMVNGSSEWVWKAMIGGANSSVIAGATSVALGRGKTRDMFVVTDGAFADPINGTFREGGKVVWTLY